MTTASQISGEARFAKGEARFARGNAKKNMVLLAVCAAARRLWPVKTAHWLAAAAGTSVRAAQLTLAESTEPNGATLARLLRSDAGFALLEEIMDSEYGAPPAWWADIQAGARMVELERRAAANRAEIERLRRQVGAGPDV